MTVRRLALALLLATACSALFATRVFTWFESVRVKVPAVPATPIAGAVKIHVDVERTGALPSPFAVIARIRNSSSAKQWFSVVVDDVPICDVYVQAGRSPRIDCAQRSPAATTYATSHDLLIQSSSSEWTLEYLELATYHGRSSGLLTAFVLPDGSNRYHLPPIGWTIVVWILLASAFAVPLPRAPAQSSRELAVARTWIGLVALLFALVAAAPLVSHYRILLSTWTFMGWTLTALAAHVWSTVGREGRAQARTAVMAHAVRHRNVLPARLPALKIAGAGLLVGYVFVSYAADIVSRHDGNISSLLLISKRFFDGNPIASERQDIREHLVIAEHGYDGQYFYNMTYDPFMRVYRHEPTRYREMVDTPPYRYGRIGFSLLTKLFSANNPRWYPAVMVSLVIISLSACGALIGLLAARHGASPWWGLLIVLVPGFWHSVDATLPEPIAFAFFLGGLLCLERRSWWAGGVLFGLCMLVRETEAALMLALIAAQFLAGRRRESMLVAVLAFAPLALWRLYVGSVFAADFGADAYTFHPDNFGTPLAGVWQMWSKISDKTYFEGNWELARAGWTFPFIVAAGVVLAVVLAIKVRTPLAIAGLVYAAMAISMNYQGAWLHVGNAERVSMDLFLALILVTVSMPRSKGLLRAMAAFWGATAVYQFFWTYISFETMRALLPWS